jgi:hypothetical protein
VVWPALPASAGRIGRDELNESESFITVNVLFILLSVLDTALRAKILANKLENKCLASECSRKTCQNQYKTDEIWPR